MICKSKDGVIDSVSHLKSLITSINRNLRQSRFLQTVLAAVGRRPRRLLHLETLTQPKPNSSARLTIRGCNITRFSFKSSYLHPFDLMCALPPSECSLSPHPSSGGLLISPSQFCGCQRDERNGRKGGKSALWGLSVSD